MKTQIQLTRISYDKEFINTKLYLTESAQQDDELTINKISESIVDTHRFGTPDEFHAAYEYTIKVAHKIIPRVAQSIKQNFSLCLSVNDICIIILPFIIQFVQTVYDRYKSILRCVSTIPNSLFVTAPSVCYVDKNIAGAMESYARDDALNLLLYSDIIRFFSYSHIDKFHIKSKFDTPTSAGHSAKRNGFQNIFALLSEQYGCLSKKNIHFAVGCYGVSFDNFYMAFSSRIINASTFILLNGNQTISSWRNGRIERYSTDDDFESLLCYLIPKYIPTELCESLNGIIAAAKQIKLPRRGVLATSVGPYADAPLMVLARVSKKPLCVVEYGGGELLKDCTKRDIDEAVPDRFFGFGKANAYYLPSPFLAEMQKSKFILPPTLIANYSYRYLPRLLPALGDGTWRPYAQQRVRFLKAVEPPLRPIIRLHVHDTFSVADKMKACFPDVVFQNYRDIHIGQVLSGSILLILDHYSTTLHRTMALNRPTILYSDAHIFTDKAMEIIEPMRSVGIWHDSPESAAAFYTNLIVGSSISWDNVKTAVDDWWFSSEVQKIREIFCDNYAMTSKNWAYHWEKAFDDLATEF